MPRRLWSLPKATPLLGLSFGQLQLLLLGVAVALSVLYWLLQGNLNPAPQFLSTFIIGNCNWLAIVLTAPFFTRQRFPWSFFTYLAILLPVAWVASWIASLASHIAMGRMEHLFQPEWIDIRSGMFFSLIAGVIFFTVGRGRLRLETRNSELERQISVGQITLQAHEAELKTAHEIQAHLLPHELPQIKPFEIACAWEPARSVGGDYFDVLTLGPGLLGICMADVSGERNYGRTFDGEFAGGRARVRSRNSWARCFMHQIERGLVQWHCAR